MNGNGIADNCFYWRVFLFWMIGNVGKICTFAFFQLNRSYYYGSKSYKRYRFGK